MSELEPYIGPHPTDNTLTEYYLKSEVDKVIADLEESHKMEVEQLLMEIVKLKDAQRWRKVSEEKPQDGQEVWAYDSSQELVIKLEYRIRESDEGFIDFPVVYGFWLNITHWMPYNKPKAPEEK